MPCRRKCRHVGKHLGQALLLARRTTDNFVVIEISVTSLIIGRDEAISRVRSRRRRRPNQIQIL